MQITFLERKPDGYWVQKSLDFSLLTLGYYLADDVDGRASDIDDSIEYLRDKSLTGSEGSMTFTEKEGENISIGNLYLIKPEELLFTTSIQNLIEIIEQWRDLRQKNPPYIVLRHKDEKVVLEGRDDLRNEGYYEIKNKNKTLFSRNDANEYFLQQSDVRPITLIGFLLLDIGLDVEEIMRSKQSLTSKDLVKKKGPTIWEKNSDGQISIGFFFSSKGITISSENLTEILDRWIAISKQKPLFALLTDDGEKITLEGKEHITDADLL